MNRERVVELGKRWGWTLWIAGFLFMLPSELVSLKRAQEVIWSSRVSTFLDATGLSLLVLAGILEYRKNRNQKDADKP